MPASLTLDQARIKLNMPNASDAEVMIAAKNAGIEISVFDNGANNVNLTQGQTKGSLFSNGLTFNNSFSGNSNTTTFGQNYTLNNSNDNVFSSGFKKQGFNNNNNFNSGLTTSNNSFVSKKYTFSSVGTTSFTKNSNLDDLLFNNFATFKPKKIDFSKIYSDKNKIEDQSKIVKVDFLENGKQVVTLEDGSTVEKQFSEEALKRFNEGIFKDVASIELKDGRVITKDKNGVVLEDRKANKGEHGYVKDGSSIQEDLVELLGTDRMAKFKQDSEKIATEISELNTELNSLTDEYIANVAKDNPKQAEMLKKRKASLEKSINKKTDEKSKLKAKLAKDYIGKIVKDCNGDPEKIQERIHSLIRNSDMTTEEARQMMNIVAELDGLSDESKKDLYKKMIGSNAYEDASDRVESMVDETTHLKGKKHKNTRASMTEAAVETGYGDVASEAYRRGAVNAIDPETGKVDKETVEDIQHNAIIASSNQDQTAIDVANDAVEMGNDDFSQATSAAVTRQIATSGNREVAEADAELRASMKDEKAQIAATEEHHKILLEEGASEETRKMDLEVQGEHLSEFNDKAQVKVDEINRKYDVDNAYNRSIANHGQDLCVEAQKVVAQRVADSGDEEAMNNMASHAYEYDVTNRDDVIKMLKEQGYESTQKALKEAQDKYEAKIEEEKAKAKANEAELKKQQNAQENSKETESKTKNTNVEQKTQKVTTSSTEGTSSLYLRQKVKDFTEAIYSGETINSIVLSEDFKNADVKDRVDFYNKLSTKDKQMAISSIVESSNPVTLKNLMFGGMKRSILQYLVSHPSPDNNSKLTYLQNYLSPVDKKELKEMKEKLFKTNAYTLEYEQEIKKHKPFMFEG